MNTKKITSPQRLAGLVIGLTVMATTLLAITMNSLACNKLKSEKHIITNNSSVAYPTSVHKDKIIAFQATFETTRRLREQAEKQAREEFIEKIMEDMPDVRKYTYSLESLDKTSQYLEDCAYVSDKEYFMVYTKEQKELIARCKYSGFNQPQPVVVFANTEKERQKASVRFTTQRNQMSIRAERYLLSLLSFCERVDTVTSKIDEILDEYEEHKKWIKNSNLENLKKLKNSKYHLWVVCEWTTGLNSYVKQLVEWYPQNFYRIARIRYNMFEYFMEKYPDLAQQIIELYPNINDFINCELDPREGITYNNRTYCTGTTQ